MSTHILLCVNMTQDEDCNGKDDPSEEGGTSLVQTVYHLYIQVRNSA